MVSLARPRGKGVRAKGKQPRTASQHDCRGWGCSRWSGGKEGYPTTLGVRNCGFEA